MLRSRRPKEKVIDNSALQPNPNGWRRSRSIVRPVDQRGTNKGATILKSTKTALRTGTRNSLGREANASNPRVTREWSVVLNTSNICDSFLRLPNVLALVPVGRSTLWLWVREGRFPKPIKLGPMTTAWRASEVSAWLEAAGRDAA